eukprot:4339344-Pyramimonas_sp.AAC.2
MGKPMAVNSSNVVSHLLWRSTHVCGEDSLPTSTKHWGTPPGIQAAALIEAQGRSECPWLVYSVVPFALGALDDVELGQHRRVAPLQSRWPLACPLELSIALLLRGNQERVLRDAARPGQQVRNDATHRVAGRWKHRHHGE